MPISAGLREDIAVYRGFIGQQYLIIRQQHSLIHKKKDIFMLEIYLQISL